MELNLKTVINNINKMTNKEKVVFIQTLLGVSAQMANFLSRIQSTILIDLPPDIHYMMLLSLANLNSIASDATAEIKDYSLNVDSYEEKLICVLKQLNEIYKNKLK